jgi:DNA-binding PadR family transcriptional regulator
MILTFRMLLILDVINRRNPDGSLVDLDQIIERVSYAVTKQAIQHTLRTMAEKEVIEKAGRLNRRDRSRMTYRVTKLGFQLIRGPGTKIDDEE